MVSRISKCKPESDPEACRSAGGARNALIFHPILPTSSRRIRCEAVFVVGCPPDVVFADPAVINICQDKKI